MSDLKKTPLYEEHVKLGARLVPFAGYAMPVQYAAGIRAEHQAVREAAGLFDVSHMGELRVSGPGAVDLVSWVTTNDPGRLEVGQVQYTVMCRETGGIVDDLLVYRLAEDELRLVVNAANLATDREHLLSLLPRFDARLEDESDRVALLAVQGPAAVGILAPLAEVDLERIRYYECAPGAVAGVPGILSRTGYTGEDGFELYVPADRAAGLWRRLLDAGGDRGLLPAGLGARDTLRLEMGYALYGNDIDEQTTPLEAGLGWLVRFDKGEFVGREALLRQKEQGPARRLRGFRLRERGFPRPGHEIVFRGEPAGPVRSGTVSPSLDVGIGTAYLPADARPGEELAVRIREREVAAEVHSLPFYTGGSLRR